MFTIFGSSNEHVCDLIQRPDEVPAPGPPLYRSVYSCKVRQDAAVARRGCWRTMGLSSTPLCPPTAFLRKHSRTPISIRPPAVPKVKMVGACVPPTEDAEGNCVPTDPCSLPPVTQPIGPPCLPPPRPLRCCTVCPKPAIPPWCTTFALVPRGKQDFIRTNAVKAIRQVPRKPAMRFVDDRKGTTHSWCTSGYPRLYVLKDEYGEVPEYLEERKKEEYVEDQKAKWAMKDKEREMAAQIRHLEGDERAALICGLKKHWEAVFGEYQAMSLLIDTPGKVERRARYEKELQEVENQIQTLERHDHLFVSDTSRNFYLA